MADGSALQPAQTVARNNRARQPNESAEYRQAREALRSPRLADLAALDDAGFRALFSKSPVKRIGRDRFVRNVLYAIGNSGDPTLIPSVETLLNDPADVVRDAAGWALARLGPLPPSRGKGVG